MEKRILTKEEHDYLVNDLGFEKVRTRCPVCYTEDMIIQKLKQSKGGEGK